MDPAHSKEKDPFATIFPSIPEEKYLEHVEAQRHMIPGRKFDGYDVEMEVLTQLQFESPLLKDLVVPTRGGGTDGGIRKDRYFNVLPYHSTRVVLSRIGDDPRSDYINASGVSRTIPGAQVTYIAASAPLPASFGDFWRMIWEKRCRLNVMLTQLVENDKLKAHQYWPRSVGATQQYGPMRVIFAEERDTDMSVAAGGERFDDIVIRVFYVKRVDGKGPQPTEDELQDPRGFPCTQIHYSGWADHGTPSDYRSFERLVRLYRAHRLPKTPPPAANSHRAPVLVHCSAGIGRTGTLCVIDMVLDYVAHSRANNTPVLFNMLSVVQLLRDQRMGMVQSKAQYAFCFLFLAYCKQRGLFSFVDEAVRAAASPARAVVPAPAAAGQ